MYLRISNVFRYTGAIKCEYRMMSSSSMAQMDKNENIVTKKMNELLIWYEQITGMHEVHSAQNRVLEEEKKLANAQEKRREVNKLVTAVQAKLRELHAELDSTPRGEDRYINLITQEHSLLKDERRLTSELQQYEREEREYFTAMSSAVKESHEKERAQAERTKYWSIIGSIIGTVIGIAGSSLNNHFKLKKLENIVKESLGVNLHSGSISQQMLQDQQYNKIVAEIKALSASKISTQEVYERIDKVLRLVFEHQVALHNKMKDFEVLLKRASTPYFEHKMKPKLGQDSVPPTRDDFIKALPPYPFTEEDIPALVGVGLGVVVVVVAIICGCCCR